jgi:hypothetical protein
MARSTEKIIRAKNTKRYSFKFSWRELDHMEGALALFNGSDCEEVGTDEGLAIVNALWDRVTFNRRVCAAYYERTGKQVSRTLTFTRERLKYLVWALDFYMDSDMPLIIETDEGQDEAIDLYYRVAGRIYDFDVMNWEERSNG